MQDRVSMNAFYGNPDANGDGRADRAWEDANLELVVPTFQMVLAWDPDTPLKRFMFHKRAAPALRRVLGEISRRYDLVDIQTYGLHLWGGANAFRLRTGSHELSVHSWGCAIDLNPEVNRFGRRYVEHLGMMPMAVVDMFRAEGFVWGGLWRKPDAMHFQAAEV